MSRVGRSPITLPKGVDLDIQKTRIKVKGPKGELTVPFFPRLAIEMEDGELTVTRPSDRKDDREKHGLARSLINNAIIGVTEGYSKRLEINGVGYRVNMKGSSLEFQLGFSHPVKMDPPEGIRFETPDQTHIVVSGIDKQLVGQVSANIRAIRSPDSYHGKGVRYEGEYIRLKPGKAAAR